MTDWLITIAPLGNESICFWRSRQGKIRVSSSRFRFGEPRSRPAAECGALWPGEAVGIEAIAVMQGQDWRQRFFGIAQRWISFRSVQPTGESLTRIAAETQLFQPSLDEIEFGVLPRPRAPGGGAAPF